MFESGEGSGTDISRRAYALSTMEDDFIPVIPESTGLELSDDGDISEIMGFLDLGNDDEREILEVLAITEEGDYHRGPITEDERNAHDEAIATSDKGVESGTALVEVDMDTRESPIEFSRALVLDEEDEVDSSGIQLALSSIDFSPLEDSDAALDGLGNLLASEAGDALPTDASAEPAAASGPTSHGQVAAPSLPDSVGNKGKESDVPGEQPLEVAEISRDWATYRGQEASWSRYSQGPVQGELPLADADTEFDIVGEDAEGDGEPEGQGPIVRRGGLYLLDSSVTKGRSEAAQLDPELRDLVDSVLGSRNAETEGDPSWERN